MAKETKAQIAAREEARKSLLEILKPGDVVYTQMHHVSKPGMMRIISAKIARDSEILDITHDTSLAIRMPRDAKYGGIKMGGCGMDMGFEVVYRLGRALWPEGFECAGEGDSKGKGRCHSNDHFNGDRDYTPHHHNDGGYALVQRWL